MVRDERVPDAHQQLEVAQAQPTLTGAQWPGPWSFPAEQELQHPQTRGLGHRLQRSQQVVRAHVLLRLAPDRRRVTSAPGRAW